MPAFELHEVVLPLEHLDPAWGDALASERASDRRLRCLRGIRQVDIQDVILEEHPAEPGDLSRDLDELIIEQYRSPIYDRSGYGYWHRGWCRCRSGSHQGGLGDPGVDHFQEALGAESAAHPIIHSLEELGVIDEGVAVGVIAKDAFFYRRSHGGWGDAFIQTRTESGVVGGR